MEQDGNANLYRVSHKRFIEAIQIWHDITMQRLEKKLYSLEEADD